MAKVACGMAGLFALLLMLLAAVGEARAELFESVAIPVGKWPEGVVFDGRMVWVAESGQRTIAAFDPDSYRMVKRVKVGRLPVEMTSAGDGRVFSLVQTDMVVWEQKGMGAGKVIQTLPKSVFAGATMAQAGSELLVLLPEENGAAFARIDVRTKAMRRGGSIGPQTRGIAAGGGQVWVAHADNRVSAIDSATFQTQAVLSEPGFFVRVAMNEGEAYAAGHLNNRGIVVAFSRDSLEARSRITLDQGILAIAVSGNSVAAVGQQGRIYVLDVSESMKLVRTIDLSFGQFEPRDVTIDGNKLYITTHRGEAGENGTLLVVEQWR